MVFHDAANSIATIVSTKVLTPFRAVLWAAFQFRLPSLLQNTLLVVGITNTVSKNCYWIYNPTGNILRHCSCHYVEFGYLVAGYSVFLFTLIGGLPVTAIIGTIIKSGYTSFGFESVRNRCNFKIASFIILAPANGYVCVSSILTILILYLFKRSNPP